MNRRHINLACVVAAATLPALAFAQPPSIRNNSAIQNPVFSTRVDQVRVDVGVYQDGRPVRGLQASDFEVFDNGVPQQIQLVGFEETPVNVVLVLDMSGSVQGDRLQQLRLAASQLIGLLRPDEAAALVTFTGFVMVRSPFSSDETRILEALEQPMAGSDTSLIDAAYAAMVLGESTAAGRPLVIVFSDGADTTSFLTAEQVLNTAKRTGSVAYAVASPQAERRGFLDELVNATGGRRVEVSSLDRLSDVFAATLRDARERYILSYIPTGVDVEGWHELTVRTSGRRADVRARPGYLAGPTP